MATPSTPSGDGPTLAQETSPSGAALGTLANLGWQALFTVGLAAIALGVVVLAWPGKTLHVVGLAFGIYLLVSGVFQLAAAFGAHVPGHLRALHFITGAISVLLGLICLKGTLQSLLLLALWIGFGWLLRGIMMSAGAASAPQAPARGWQIFLGIITMLAGIVLIVSPFSSIAVLALVAGIMAIVLGVTEVIHAIRMRVEIGRLTKGTTGTGTTPKHRRSLFHPHPHPQH
ncbi:HdeD family acid-resistance protein [Streptomyces sp. WZ-12]|uniref:HdeD family acid-resistance protein n=1 Tax=Streptomyces sp. WZ-12 TaxID=3030210 RepID=UPI002380EC30|nr:HdeD family acid-resistance protein [Streptomyces sp. WZ-12]